MSRSLFSLLFVLAVALGAPAPSLAFTPPEIRLLQSGDPADWEKAVQLIIPTDQYAVPGLLVSAVTERLPGLSPATQLRVIRKMSYALERDPRVVTAFRQLALTGEDTVRIEAQRALDRYLPTSGKTPASRPADPGTSAWLSPLLRGLALLLVLAPLALGAALFLWGFRLLQLQRLLRHLPVSHIRTLTPGQVALRGEVQSAGEPLFHPLTDELCVYYVGAETRVTGLRFWLVDDSGRVQVDPAGMVMLSADGMLLPGEEVQLIASVERVGAGNGPERWLIRKNHSPRSAFEKLVHLVVGRLFGVCAGSNFSKMLFSDPQRCFWIWDDLVGNPFGGRRELALVVAVFTFAGVWVATAAFVAAALLDRDLRLLISWLG